MQQFSSISVSSYEAGSLAERLDEQSRDGWSVVAIVPTGSTVTAYLCRDADDAAIAEAAHEPASEPAAVEPTPSEPTLAGLVHEPSAEPAAEATPYAPSAAPSAGAESVPSVDAPNAAAGVSSGIGTETGATTAESSAAGAAPAGWYADPSGRFELRYWDGGQWTEHVSRAGQQYTDPPVA